MPDTENGWREIAVGCIDGKHIVMQNPANTGNMYLNCKGTFFIVLLAICDAKRCYTFAYAGFQGRISDGGAFPETTFYKEMERKTLNLPNPEPLAGQVEQPCVILGGALTENLMKPYTGVQLEVDSRMYKCSPCYRKHICSNVFSVSSVPKTVIVKCRRHKTCRSRVLLRVFTNFRRKRSGFRRIYHSSRTLECERQDGTLVPGAWRNITQGDTGTLEDPKEARRLSEMSLKRILRQEKGV